MDWRYGVRFPSEGRDISVKRPDRLYGLSKSLARWVMGILSPASKRSEGEADRSLKLASNVFYGNRSQACQYVL